MLEQADIDFSKVLAAKKQIIWPVIEDYLENSFRPILDKFTGDFPDMADYHYNLVSEYPRRQGKYIRPSLVVLTAEAMGTSADKSKKTAAAMQISEDWVLIHDDWEDGSLERRGEATLHRQYSPELAINAGDSLHILMWKVIQDNITVLGPEKTAKVANEFYQMLTRTALGQTVEIKWTQENKIDLTDEDWFFVADGKTAYYSIAGPMRLGAIIAGATEEQLEELFNFGTYLGRCFQIRDDILDLTSTFSGQKKQKGNDIYEGKRTLMLIHLLRSLPDNEREKVLEVFQKTRDQKTPQDVELVIKLMKKYGSIEYSQKVAEDFMKKALEIFQTRLTFLSYDPARSELEAGINFILNRKR